MTIDEIKRQIFIDSEEVCGNTMIDTYQAQEYAEQAYNKAIDDFVEYVWETTSSSDIEWITRDYELYDFLQKKAEQLKAGVKE